MPSLSQLNRQIIHCTMCPRLVEFREDVARRKRRMYLDWDYWGKPVPGFGDPNGRVLILGLAPAAHGANRTGRMFTGDRSGDWLLTALHKFGYSNKPISRRADDDLRLTNAYITASLRCAPPGNKPTGAELSNCRPYLLTELDLLKCIQVVVALGKVAFDSYLTVCKEQGISIPSPRPRFGHGAVYPLPNKVTLVGSYHPSQQNTQTGKLTREMLDAVFAKARELLS